MAVYSSTSTRRSLIDTAIFRTLSQLATVLGYVLLVRGLEEHSFGIYNILYSFIPVISMVASLGLVQTLRRYQPEYLSRGQPEAADWLVRLVVRLRLASNLLVLAAVLVCWNLIAPLLKLEGYRADFIVFCVLILLYFQTRIFELALAAHMLHRFSVGAIALLGYAKLIGYGLLIGLGKMTLLNAILVDIVAHAIAFGIMRVVYARRCAVREASAFRPDSGARRRMLRYGFFNNFNDSGAMILTPQTANLFVAAIMNPLGVAIYSFYARLCEMTLQVLPIRLFENVVQPVFIATEPSAAQVRIPRYFSLLLNLNMLVFWPALTYLLAFHSELVDVVFGGKFGDSSWLLMIMLPFAVAEVFTIPLSLVAQYQEKAHILLFSKWTAVYNLIGLFVLVPPLGVLGAALATGSAQILKIVFIWWHVRQLAVWRDAWKVLLTGIVTWGFAGLLCLLAGRLVDSSLLRLITGAVIVGIAWLIFVRKGGLSADDRSILDTLVRGRERSLFVRLGVVTGR
jgi:O-antigen/teichoic acid export membrane protein